MTAATTDSSANIPDVPKVPAESTARATPLAGAPGRALPSPGSGITHQHTPCEHTAGQGAYGRGEPPGGPGGELPGLFAGGGAEVGERAGDDLPHRPGRPAAEQLAEAEVAKAGAVPFLEADQLPVPFDKAW